MIRSAGVRTGLRVGLAALLTFFLFRAVGFGVAEFRSLPASGRSANPALLLTSGALLLGGYACSALLWSRLVLELGGPRLPPASAIRIHLWANLGRYIPGKIWQMIGLVNLAGRAGLSPGLSATSAVAGQLLALGGASLIGLLALGAEGVLPRIPGRGAFLAALVLFILLAAVVPTRPRAFSILLERVARIPGIAPPARLAGDRLFGVRWIGLHALNWLIFGVAFWLLARAFDLPIGIPAAAGSFAAAWVIGYASLLAPAGIGVREGILVLLLAPRLGTDALLLSVVSRLWTTGVELLALPLLPVLSGLGIGAGKEAAP